MASAGRVRKNNDRPRFYFSLRSPYSWLAYRELMDRWPRLADVLDWRPFWEPDERSEQMLAAAGGTFPYVAMSRAKSLYILQDVRRIARERGLQPAWPVDRAPVWEVPHLAYFAALDHGRGLEFIERAYQVRWEEGRDICERTTIAEIAGELRLPETRLAHAADDDTLRERGLAALLDVDADGVFGVPFFVDRPNKFWGLDRLTAFVDSIGETTVPAPVSPTEVDPGPGRGGDQGHAGGCG